MSAVPDNIVQFQLPKKPRIKEQAAPPDQRKVAVIPIRALADDQIGDATFRALATLCSYCNRAGITWVSQKKLAEVAKMSQQAISKHMTKLVKAGYVEIVRKGFRGEKTNTLRVIFDPTVDTETAIAVTSSIENTRPPTMDDRPDPDGQRRVAQLIAKALKQPTKKEYTMPASGQSRTVKKMKEEIAKHKAKQTSKGTHTQPQEAVDNSPTYTTPEVVHEAVQKEPPYTTSYTTSEVVLKHKNIGCIEVIKEYLNKDCLIQLHNNGLTDEVIADNLSILLDTYRAEGLTPKPEQLMQDIMQLSKV